MVKNMHSKWADACGQIIAFDRALSTECNLTSDPFCCHIVRLFSQLSAMATMRLHIVEPGQSLMFDAVEGKHPSRVRLPTMHATSRSLSRQASKKVSPTPGELNPMARQSTAKLSLEEKTELQAVTQAADKHHEAQHHRTKADKISELAAGISKAERQLLLHAPCPVFATAQRIQRAIISRLHAGGMRAPPPIISRIFQEVSNGLLFYNNATKMKEIPVPFPYVQLNAFLLNVFSCVLCPIAIASFTPVLWLSITTTVVTVLSFYAVFIVANELEDPFGTEDNDMPMIEFHEEFCASLCMLISNAWLPEDQWLVKEGKWIQPRNIALAVNAFGDKIGKRGVGYYSAHNSRSNKPYDTLLNRAKANRARRTELPVPSFFSGGFFSSAKSKAAAGQMPGVVVTEDVDRHAAVIQRSVRKHVLANSIRANGIAKPNGGPVYVKPKRPAELYAVAEAPSPA